MANQVLTIVTFTTLLIARIEPVSTYKISSADPDVIRINLGHKRLVKETVPLHSKLLIKCNFDAPAWFKNGKPITTDNRRAKSLKFNSIKKTDAGYYSCGSEYAEWSNLTLSVFSQHEAADHYQSDSPGSGSGNVANLEKKSLSSAAVTAPLQQNELSEDLPVFVVGSRDHVATVTKREGEFYRLRCEVAGEPKFRISWSKDGEVFNSKTGNRSNVSMDKLTVADNGVYVCRVCNGHVCVNSTTKVEVLVGDSEEPIISYNNMEKHSQVSNSDEPVGVDYVDDHNGEDYDEEEEGGEEEVENEEDEGGVGGPLRGSVHETSETTENQPVVGGSGGDLPPGKPFFTKPDQLVSLMPKPSGNMVRLRCPAAGNPMPNITWTKNDTAVQRNMGSVKYAKWSIVLEDLVEADSGQYTCNVCNVHGCIHFTTTLKVKDRFPARPYIKEGYLVNTTVLVNSTAQLECRTISDLEPHIEWIKFNVDVENPVIPRNMTKLERDADNPEVLTLYNVTHEDEGWYTCVAANTLGSSLEKAYLRVVDELPEDDIPTAHPVRHHSTLITVMTMVLSGCFMVLAIIVVIVCKKLKREKMKHRAMEHVNQWTKKVIVLKQPPVENSIPGVTDAMQMPIVRIEKQRSTLVQSGNCDPALISEYEFPIDLNWEFPRNKLLLGKSLGEGAFGKVVMAEAQGLVKGQASTVVAVKMLKEGHTDADVKDLVCEMEVMKMIGKHVNIINLLGCCCKDGPLYVIVEYAPHGNLKDFLRGHRFGTANYEDMISGGDKEKKILTQKELISFAYQIARGMEHLASRRCIHRDLAARNVLVSDGYVMKIADFGLARDIHSQEYYRKTTTGKLPIRWMAPESLEEKFYDSQSDVWSFGVLLWEIMTLGGNPYSSIPTWDNLLEHLKKGKRLEQPPLCSIDIYLFMRECWHYRPEERPTFSEIVQHLDRLVSITSNEEYLDLGLPLLETPPSSDDDEEDDEDALDEPDGRQAERMRMYPFSHHHFSHHTTESSF
ncbi:fibroblast growth factor receptor homolog 1 isoform X1 [Culex quinquefasciatus]|uniref:fibroblast growth factor receptor homolog 1 isoform X1 n=1 Tax=Culex quinquefasciatus TaxID=7176 RepID=UPI0018E31E86|nr:fibroblast growth factor receptor homolog 1 isoform X1 [Culex quinquefasciatus]XP_038122529.1 fibroblast growth factor receptor homolog 1 isoform X1 [Culex quinquefasciatus]